jgi:S-adenosylmethionine hydrolase
MKIALSKRWLAAFIWILVLSSAAGHNKIVVFQSDFGLKDGAVSEMKGVAMEVSPDLKLFDLTHEIPPYNIWEAAYRLKQTVPFWPQGTVFVSVVDPGVGTSRKSVVLKTRTGQFIVSPDNGTLTLVVDELGIEEVRQIDESVNRRKSSEKSYTFHGRDVYAYTAARLASGAIRFEQVGPLLPAEVVRIPFQPAVADGNQLKGSIPILDIRYGNVWTNIPNELFQQMHVRPGDFVHISIFHSDQKIYEGDIPYELTFGEVPAGSPVAYLNSLMQLSFALNQGNFAETYHIASGSEWNVNVSKKIKHDLPR